MIECVSVENMRLSDRQTVQKGVSSKELIARAARQIYHQVDWHGKIAVVAGSGNNGADGFALAELLAVNNFSVTVFKVSQNLHDDCAYYAQRARESGVSVLNYQSGCLLNQFDMIVDCMLGTGFSGDLKEAYRCAIDEINQSNAYVISVDINSGMIGDTGEGNTVVRSDLTVAIQFVKNGMVTQGAGRYIGKLVSVSIGIELAKHENQICTENEWSALCEDNHGATDLTELNVDGITYYRCPAWLCMEYN